MELARYREEIKKLNVELARCREELRIEKSMYVSEHGFTDIK